MSERLACPKWRTAAVVGMALALTTTACGSRLSHERLLADARGASATSDAGGSADSGSAGEASIGTDGATSSGTAPGASEALGSPTAAVGGGSGEAGGNTPVKPGQSAGGATAGTVKSSGSSARAAGGTAKPGGSAVNRSAGASQPAGAGPASPSGGPTAAPPQGSACSGQKPPIIIGTVGEQSGLVGAYEFSGVQAVRAWVASINTRGGLHCHPVKYIVADDGGDPSRNQALTQKMVEQDGVIAFVYNNAPLAGQGSVDYINRKRIPVVGSDTASPWFNHHPMHFPQASSGEDINRGAVSALAQVAKPLGKTKLAAVSCVEAATCSGMGSLVADLAAQYGLKLVYNAKVTLAQPDYTSNCQAAKEAAAELFIAWVDGNATSRIARSCAALNFRPIFVTDATAVLPDSFAKDQNLNGVVLGTSVAPWTANIPAITELVNTLKRYGPGVPMKGPTVAGWASAKLFETAVKNVPDVTSPEDILAGLWSVKNNDLGGLTGLLTFTKGAPNNRPGFCHFIAQLKDGVWGSPNGNQRTCE